MITVVAIDCGFASCGYAEVSIDRDEAVLVHRMGTIRTAKSDKKMKVLAADDDTRRARQLSQGLSTLIRDTGVVCIESLSIPFVPGKGGKGRVPAVKAATQTAMCIGIVVAHAQVFKKALLQATPQQVKKAVCGKGNASKDEVKAAMQERFGKNTLERLLDSTIGGQRVHAYDALSVACCCIETDEVRLLLATAPQPVRSTG